MAEFKEVIEKANRICKEHNGCSEECPIYKFSPFCPFPMFCLDMNEANELENAIMNYDTDWSKVPVDTKILVRNDTNDYWEKRYFARYDGETVYAFDCGQTSWTSHHTSFWKYAKLYEEGEYVN